MKKTEIIIWIILSIIWMSFWFGMGYLSDCMNQGRLARTGEWDAIKTFQQCIKL